MTMSFGNILASILATSLVAFGIWLIVFMVNFTAD